MCFPDDFEVDAAFTESFQPRPSRKYAMAVVYENTVTLVEHHFAAAGDIDTIFEAYLNQKVDKIVRD